MGSALDVETGVGGNIQIGSTLIQVGMWRMDKRFVNARCPHSGSGGVMMRKRIGEDYRVIAMAPFTPGENPDVAGAAGQVVVELNRSATGKKYTGKMLLEDFRLLYDSGGEGEDVGDVARWQLTLVCAGANTLSTTLSGTTGVALTAAL